MKFNEADSGFAKPGANTDRSGGTAPPKESTRLTRDAVCWEWLARSVLKTRGVGFIVAPIVRVRVFTSVVSIWLRLLLRAALCEGASLYRPKIPYLWLNE